MKGSPLSTDCALRPASQIAAVGLGVAHHRRQDEERVLPFAVVDALALLVRDTSVVGIHERVRAALQLVVNS